LVTAFSKADFFPAIKFKTISKYLKRKYQKEYNLLSFCGKWYYHPLLQPDFTRAIQNYHNPHSIDLRPLSTPKGVSEKYKKRCIDCRLSAYDFCVVRFYQVFIFFIF